MVENSFDFFIANSGIEQGKRDALIAVADTMWMGKLWFEHNKFEPTADQLLRFAELVLKYEQGQTRLALITDDYD